MIHRQSIPLSLLTNNSPPVDTISVIQKKARLNSKKEHIDQTPNQPQPTTTTATTTTTTTTSTTPTTTSTTSIHPQLNSSSTESDEDESTDDNEKPNQPITIISTTNENYLSSLTETRRRSSITNYENGLANYIKISKKRTRDEINDNNDPLYQCLDCNQTFATTSELRQHKKSQHHIQTYKCRRCGELFRSIADRQTHKNNKHFDTISCSIESENFDTYSIGNVVSSERNEAGYFTCPITYCTFVTRIPGYWYDHIHHVSHNGENPQKRKKRASVAPSTQHQPAV